MPTVLFPKDAKLHFNLFPALLLVIQLLPLVMHNDNLYLFISLFLLSVFSFLSYEKASFDVQLIDSFFTEQIALITSHLRR